MYRYLQLSLLFLLTHTGISQSITSAWYYEPGDTSIVMRANNALDLDFPEEGVDQTWDFSAAEGTASRTQVYQAAQELMFIDSFPEADTGYFLSGYEYFLNEADDRLEIIGVHNASVKLEFLDNFPVVAYDDFTYGDENTISYRTQISFTDMSRDTMMSNYTDAHSFVGLGEVTTPVGRYENCVMIRFSRSIDDITTYVQYAIYKDKLTNLIADFSYDPREVDDIDFIWQVDNEQLTGITEEETLDFQVYTPSRGTLAVATDTSIDACITLLDLGGQKLIEKSAPLHPGTNLINIPTSLVPGQYYVLLMDKANGQFATEKVIMH